MTDFELAVERVRSSLRGGKAREEDMEPVLLTLDEIDSLVESWRACDPELADCNYSQAPPFRIVGGGEGLWFLRPVGFNKETHFNVERREGYWTIERLHVGLCSVCVDACRKCFHEAEANSLALTTIGSSFFNRGVEWTLYSEDIVGPCWTSDRGWVSLEPFYERGYTPKKPWVAGLNNENSFGRFGSLEEAVAAVNKNYVCEECAR